MKFSALMMILLFSTSSFAVLLTDGIRQEIKTLAQDGHTPGHSYSTARKMIMQNVHLRSDELGYFVKDVYCRKQHRNNVGPSDMPNHQNINIEHTWPRSRFKGKGSSSFSVKEADLHHLYPTNSRANSSRGNHIFSEFSSGNELNNCASSKRGTIPETGDLGFEPPSEHKGNVARALFYFAVRYDIKISAHEEFFLRQWNIIDPVDAEEMKRNDSVEALQGNRNPFIDDAQLADLIQNF